MGVLLFIKMALKALQCLQDQPIEILFMPCREQRHDVCIPILGDGHPVISVIGIYDDLCSHDSLIIQ